MVALADVRRWDPARVEAVFTALGSTRDRLSDLTDEQRAAAPPAGWLGVAADAARAEHTRIDQALLVTADGIGALRPPVADAVDAVTVLRRDLDHADQLAAARGFAVGADGRVTDTLPVPTTAVPDAAGLDSAGLDAWQRTGQQAELVGLYDQVLRRAADIDTTLADLLARATTDHLAQLQPAGTTTPAAAPPPGAGPEANHTWWTTLSADQRAEVLLRHPGWVGGLDGIPAAVRDSANRSLLITEQARLDHEITAATTRLHEIQDSLVHAPGAHVAAAPFEQDLRQLQDQQAALAAVHVAAGEPDARLLLLDLTGHAQPHAAVAVGDIDTADHVAVFTPGFTTTVEGALPGYTRDMAALRDLSTELLVQNERGGETVATVAWLGYDAPQGDTVFSPPDSVLGPFAAQEGGRELSGFLGGIDATREGDEPHLTALGHSYGSTTTGYALTDAAVDDAVFFGSPGISTGDLSDLGVPPGHVAVLEAGGDVTADLGAFGLADPNQLDGATNLSARDETGPDGAPLQESSGHSDYLTPGTTSQHNIAATVADLPENRITGENAGFGDFVRGGAPAIPEPPW